MMQFIMKNGVMTPNDELQTAIIREDGKAIRNRQTMSDSERRDRKIKMRCIVNSDAYLRQFT